MSDNFERITKDVNISEVVAPIQSEVDVLKQIRLGIAVFNGKITELEAHFNHQFKVQGQYYHTEILQLKNQIDKLKMGMEKANVRQELKGWNLLKRIFMRNK